MPKTTVTGRGLDGHGIRKRRMAITEESVETLLQRPAFNFLDPEHYSNRVVSPVDLTDGAVARLRSKERLPFLRPVVKVDADVNGENTVIALLDTGVAEHKALEGKVIEYLRFDGQKGSPGDEQGHGTHLAGILAADPIGGDHAMKGLAPGTRIVSIKLTEEDYDEAPIWRVTRGLEAVIRYNETHKENKITAVLVCYNAADNMHTPVQVGHHALARHVAALFEQNIPVICSAGNLFAMHQEEGLAYPAYVPKIFAVASLMNFLHQDDLGQYSASTQRMHNAHEVFDVFYTVAPGYFTVSTGIDTDISYTALSGSSQAAAVVAGTILLLQSAHLRDHGTLPDLNTLYSKLPHQPTR